VLPLPDEKKCRGGTAAVFHGGAMATQTNKIVNASFFFIFTSSFYLLEGINFSKWKIQKGLKGRQKWWWGFP